MSALFDIQVNGYAGVDFNSESLGLEAIERACLRLEADGVDSILATIITARLDVMGERIAALVRAVEQSAVARRVVRGIHVEGPFISDQPGYVGAHPAAETRPARVSDAEQLVAAGHGLVKLVTLAPERDDGFETTRWLADRGVVVSAGHCNPTIEQLRGAIDHGLTMFTHLGNGCPLLMPRHDNIVQRVLSLVPTLWVCFIADDVHIPYVALRNYLKVVGPLRAIVVSDAISAAGLGVGKYSLAGMPVVVDDDLATWSSDRQHLMGSACPLRTALDKLVDRLSISREVAERMASENPRRALGTGATEKTW